MEKKDSMRVIRRLFVSLVPIQALAVGLPAINTLLSSILVGNFLGEDALAAVGFAGPMLLCINAVARTFAGGAQVIASKAIGRGDRNSLNLVFNTAMVLCLLFGIMTTVLCCSLAEGIAVLQGAVGENITNTAEFVRGVGVGMGFSAMSACVFIFLQIERMDRASGIISGIMAAVNVGGNALNVFCLHWGLFGSGLFLALSNIVAAIIGLVVLMAKGKLFRFARGTFSWKEVWHIISCGYPNAVTTLACVVRNRVTNHYVFLLGGNVAMAALAVADNFTTSVGGVIEAGYAGSSKMVAGMLYGQRDVHGLRNLTSAMAKSTGWVFVAAYLLVFALSKPFATLMGAAPEQLSVYAMIIRVNNLWFITNILATPPRQIYEAMGKEGFVSVLTFSLIAGCSALILVLLAEKAGLWMAVSTTYLVEIVQIVLLALIVGIKMHRMPQSIFEQCYIPSTFSAPKADRFERTIVTPEDAAEASRQAIEFCKSKQMDAHTASYCGLCIEEMAGDTIANRFKNSKSTIDLRMLYEDGHIRILLRDDCVHFDPNEWLKLCAAEDETRSIGLRTVSKLANKMEYVNALGLNVLTIEL